MVGGGWKKCIVFQCPPTFWDFCFVGDWRDWFREQPCIFVLIIQLYSPMLERSVSSYYLKFILAVASQVLPVDQLTRTWLERSVRFCVKTRGETFVKLIWKFTICLCEKKKKKLTSRLDVLTASNVILKRVNWLMITPTLLSSKLF